MSSTHSRVIVIMLRRLNSINDLKTIDFGESVPKHSLILLYWFANTIEIDYVGNMRLNFEPGDYGSHIYHNIEGLLDTPPSQHCFYTIGNIYQHQYNLLPNYVVRPPIEYNGENSDRIIVRVKWNGRRQEKAIDQVFITQHLPENEGSAYDSRHTYQITPNLIGELRRFNVVDNQRQLLDLANQFNSRANGSQISCIKHKWPVTAGLGLLLFIVIEEKSSPLKLSFSCSCLIAILLCVFLALFYVLFLK